MASLQRQVDKLQTLGVNKIIALGHSGFTVDQDVARRVRGVDVVIGGHTNTFLYTGERWGGCTQCHTMNYLLLDDYFAAPLHKDSKSCSFS